MKTNNKTKDTSSSAVSVILPSYNESNNITEAITRIAASVGDQLKEIIVVDDNSPDQTWKVVEDLQLPYVTVMRRMTEKGLSSALDDGIRSASGDKIVWLDCDLGLSPEEIPALIAKLDQYDVAIASRYVKGGKDPRPPLRVFLSVMINFFAAAVLGFGVRDYTSGFCATKREVFDTVSFSRHGFGEYFIDFAYRCQKNNFTITEVPCVYRVRSGGVSKSDGNVWTLLKLGRDYGLRILSLRFKG
ncbi:MAG: glycosyltransferase [Nanoarchaeota archaeon]|nr:glycosyltransferase [Nanoarchaeota archaeon]